MTVNSNESTLTNGQASWNYNLSGAADATALQVLDSSGKVVWSEAATNNAKGDHTYAWNGKDQSGRTLPDGVYTLKVSAVDTNGQAITSTASYTGIASGIANVAGVTELSIGNINAPLTAVTAVKTAPAS